MIDVHSPLLLLLSFLLVVINLTIMWEYIFSWIFVGVVVSSLGVRIAKNIYDTLQSSEYEYAPYLYNKYHIFRIKKQLGKLYINEPFIWTDEQAYEERRIAFEYATTIHGGA